MTYEEVQKNVRKGIEEYFKLQLGRPEILNRIGENIVVFDFIREDVADQILKAQVNKIIRNLQSEKKIILSLSDRAMAVLRAKAVANLDNGGRGIGNIVESLLINPLSRYLFDNEIFEEKTVVIEDVNAEIQPYSLNCTVS
jgi:ATP-dependent Clp protease ATP-binding subunit ClpA